ncbi:MAG: endonuclease/exonuclease/phosphatase family protein, partial [Anaerolineales bacterium]|nr:endonuclease/exonuclease/phosphatase family protein [Anaerolineales bacterium]
ARKLLSIRFILVAVFGIAGVLLVPAIVQLPGGRPARVFRSPPTALSPEARGWGQSAAPPNEGPPLVSVCKIQGSGFSSPYEGQQRRTRGIVTADLAEAGQKGFFIQDPGCDANPHTSDGLFVNLGVSQSVAAVGDLVETAGIVKEHFGLTELATSPGAVTIISSGHSLPDETELNPPLDNNAARFYFETLEGMLVRLNEGTAAGPTSLFDDTWFIRTDLGIDRLFHDHPGGTGVVIRVDGEGLVRVEPPMSVGDQIENVTGVVGYQFGDYRVHLLKLPDVYPAASAAPDGLVKKASGLQDVIQTAGFSFSAATFNVQNLFDATDDPGKDDPVRTAAAYQRHLEKLGRTISEAMAFPDLIGLQEVENEAVLEDLLARPELDGFYDFVLAEGPDQRGIDVALLYRSANTRLISFEQMQGCTELVDGLGPDGNLDMESPQNDLVCDLDGDGSPDGNRLFSRPPLVVEIQVCQDVCLPPPGVPAGPSMYLWLIVVHLKSKTQDTPWNAYTLPRRIAQAGFIAGLADDIRLVHADANLMVLGDLNDYSDSPPLAEISKSGLVNLTARLPASERYTYIYRGVSQVLDYVLVNHTLLDEHIVPEAIHINVDFPAVLGEIAASPYRSSDHDPIVVNFSVFPHRTYLPVLARQMFLNAHRVWK